MSLKFKCRHCSEYLQANDSYAGHNVECPMCGELTDAPLTRSIARNITNETFGKGTEIKTIEQFLSTKHPSFFSVSNKANSSKDEKYNIGEVIAQGGMGMVIEAKDLNLKRKVAMKVLQAGDQSHEDVLRFIEEAQITGQLQHPSIVPVYELGVDSKDNVYYTMKCMEGEHLKEILDNIRNENPDYIQEYPLGHLLNIFMKVCDAIAMAHSKGVVHRDLKPENIMIGDFGEVTVIDWGIAKFVDVSTKRSKKKGKDPGISDDAIESIRAEGGIEETMSGSIVGTLRYMSPEQAMGKVNTLDTRSDIYSLGVILYEILSLRRPADGDTRKIIYKKVVNGRLTPINYWNVSKRHRDDRLILCHLPGLRLPSSLAAVAMKALAFKPKERYQSVKGLQKDIEAWQSGYATTAEEAGFLTQVKLLLNRNKKELIALGCFLVLLGFFFVNNYFKIKAEKLKAEDISIELLKEKQTVVDALDAADAAKVKEIEVRKQMEFENYIANIGLASNYINQRNLTEARKILEKCPERFRNWEWGHLMYYCDEAYDKSEHVSETIMSFYHKGNKYVSYNRESKSIKRHLNNIEIEKDTKCEEDVTELRFSPDGTKFLAVQDNYIYVYRFDNGKLIRRFGFHVNSVSFTQWSPDSTKIISSSSQGDCFYWNAASGEVIKTFEPGRAYFKDDNTITLLTTKKLTEMKVYSLNPIELKKTIQLNSNSGLANEVAHSKTADLMAIRFPNFGVEIWDSKVYKLKHRLTGDYDKIRFSPDGKRLAAATIDGKIRIYEVGKTRPIKTFTGHRSSLIHLLFTKNEIISADHTELMKWKLNRIQSRKKLAPKFNEPPLGVTFGKSKYHIYTVIQDNLLKWDENTGSHSRLQARGVGNGRFVMSPNREKILLFNPAILFSLSDNDYSLLPHQNVVDGTWSGDGKYVITLDRRGMLVIYDSKTLKTVKYSMSFTKNYSISANPKKYEVIIGGDPDAKKKTRNYIFNYKTKSKYNLSLGKNTSVKYSPDGKYFVAAGHLWNEKSKKRLYKINEKYDQVVFTRDSKRMLFLRKGLGSIRIVDTKTGKQVMFLQVDSRPLTSLAISSDGKSIVAGTDGKKLILLNAQEWQ